MAYTQKIPQKKEKYFEIEKPKYEIVTTDTKVYSFKNLPKEAQEKALDKYREINVEHDWWDYDGIADAGLPNLNKKSYLQSKGVKKGGMFFSYDNQKLGFDLDRYNYLNFGGTLKVEDEEAFRKVLKIPKSTWNKSYYLFDESRESDTALIIDENDYSKPFNAKDKIAVERAENIFKEIMRVNKQSLKNQYEYLLSDEAIKETFEANDYKFTEDGKKYFKNGLL